MARRLRLQSEAQRTLNIIRDGCYKLEDETLVCIESELKKSIDDSFFVSEEVSDSWFNSDDVGAPSNASSTAAQEEPKSTSFEVSNITATAAVRNLLTETDSVGVLNFASAKNPGGGFLRGAVAQEESLAIASGLYPTLVKFSKEYYSLNKRSRRGFYTDTIIYSPNVPFFRDDDRSLILPFYASVLTCPAVNKGVVLREYDDDAVETAMQIRIRKILHLFKLQGNTHIVLGAYGCGVFKNSVPVVANIFKSFLKDGGEFENVFDKVVFAIYDRNEEMFLRPFQEVFC